MLSVLKNIATYVAVPIITFVVFFMLYVSTPQGLSAARFNFDTSDFVTVNLLAWLVLGLVYTPWKIKVDCRETEQTMADPSTKEWDVFVDFDEPDQWVKNAKTGLIVSWFFWAAFTAVLMFQGRAYFVD